MKKIVSLMILILLFACSVFSLRNNTEGIMPYCSIDDLISKVDIDKLLNIGNIAFPDNLTADDYNELFGGLSIEDKALIDSSYTLNEDVYILNRLSTEQKKQFLKIYLTLETVDTIENAIISSGQLIDGYLTGRYQVPLSSVPDNIKIFAVNISIAELLIDKGVIQDSEADKAIIKRKDEAIKFLEKVASGTFSLPIKNDDNVAPVKDDFISYETKPKLDMNGFL
ncbi:MAG: DUF1320 domain-containing protein [Spirochaetes bacterium]|nr:DUF1320 domain-containing protein [Spirochaetota bacterium]